MAAHGTRRLGSGSRVQHAVTPLPEALGRLRRRRRAPCVPMREQASQTPHPVAETCSSQSGEERRKERQLITEYEAMIAEIMTALDKANHRFAVQLARLPDEIRGFGPVKESSIVSAEKKRTSLMNQLRQKAPDATASPTKAPEPAE